MSDDDDEFVRSFLARHRGNPLLKQYYALISRPGRHCEPWHALGQRLHIADSCAWAICDEDIEVRGPIGPIELAPRNALLRETAGWIENATPFLWSCETERIADAAPLPKHIISPNVLPAASMFWTFETATFAKLEKGYVQANCCAIRHDPAANGLMIFFDQCEVDALDEPVKQWNFGAITVTYGSTWPDDFQGSTEWLEGIGRLLKRCAFLNSPYVDKAKARLARHYRRQMERAGEPPEKVEEEVRVVKLRREVKERTTKAAEHSGAVEWQHHWWVSGHYRAQWYPHEEAHRVIWIAPYLKGPTDKPFLEKVYAVVR
jgi:hypothetical protein